MWDLRSAFFAVFALTIVGSATAAAPDAARSREVLATVNGEPVTRAELELQIASFHVAMQSSPTRTEPPDASRVLDRMIEARLIVQEARNIGLEQLPEVRQALEVFEREQLRRLLYDREIAGIARPDPATVERLYRRATTRHRISSARFDEEGAAEEFAVSVRGGGDFDALVSEAVALRRARPGDQGVWIREEEILAEVGAVVAGLSPGGTSGPIRVGDGFTVVRLLESETVDDPEARSKAEADALRERRVEGLRTLGESLRSRYCTVDREVFEGIDYDAPQPGFAGYAKDDRIVARIQGEDPITVAALTEALQRKYFHGAEGPHPRRRYAERKAEVLDEMLLRSAAVLEARRRKLDRGDAFLASVRGFEEELLFGEFVRRVIDPEIRLDQAALRKHYDANLKEYAGPERMKLQSLVFARRAEADAAIERLRQGATFEWIRENAAGQIPAGERGAISDLLAAPVAMADLPEGARKALAGAKAGDERLYEDPDGSCYVLQVREVLPASALPFEAVRGKIAAKLEGEARQRAVGEWAEKLRAVYSVERFVDAGDLNRLLLEGSGGGS